MKARKAPEVSLELTKTHLVIRIPIEARLMPIAEKARVGVTEPPFLPPQTFKVFEGLRKGLCNKEIAHEMRIGERTVKFHVAKILSRVGVTSRVEVIRRFGFI